MEQLMKCPHCNNFIEKLEYTSDVTETGRLYVTIENDKAEECERETDESNTESTNTYCPNCGEDLSPNEIILLPNLKQKKKEIEYKKGDIIMIIRDTCNHGYPKETKLKINKIQGNMYYGKNSHSYFTKRDIKLFKKGKKIDNGQSETEEIIIEKEPETYETDPMINYGAICPKCKHFFADNTEIKTFPGLLSLTELETNKNLTTCPKCMHEFDREKEYKKLTKIKNAKT